MVASLEDFNTKLINIMKTKKPNSSFLTKERYDDLLKKVNSSKSKTSGKKPEDYQRLKRYDILKVGNVEKLIFPKSKDDPNVRFYVHSEELFTIIHETHLSLGHGGRNKMIKELQKRYKNITTEEVMIYLNLCENCQKKSKVSNKALVIRPINFQEMLNSRCQVDIIDMQVQPDDEFKFILIYKDYVTKFVQLRALKTKRPEEVADRLIDIFTIFGAPSILQSDKGREFSSRIVEEACSLWPDLKLVHGTAVHGQIHDSRERENQDIENMISCWLENKRTTKWSEGLRFVQLTKNRTVHENLKCTPYEAMFGNPARVGLRTSSFPNDSLEHLRTEEDLQDLLEAMNNASEDTKSDINDTDASNGISQHGAIPEIDFEGKIEHDTEVTFIRTNVLSGQKQTRKRGAIAKEGFKSRERKMLKVSNVKSSDGKAPDIDASDPRNILEVILKV